MIPERSRSFSERFGAVEAPKSQIISNIFADRVFCCCRKIICWELFEMDFGGVSAGLELISGGKQSFEVWCTAVGDVKITYFVGLTTVFRAV